MRRQNSFWRLKHYRVTSRGTDPKENHATESLAALLRWSPTARKAVIRLLCENTTKSQLPVQTVDQLTIETQVPMLIEGATCYLDLLIRRYNDAPLRAQASR